MFRRLLALVALLAASATAPVMAQGFLMIPDRPMPLPRPIPRPSPTPPANYAIKELSVDARITDQVARIQVTQTFVNHGSTQIEAQFVFPLPYDGAIDKLTLLVDGKEFPAQLLSREEARKKYEAIVRSNRDPALLEWMGQGMFQTSVFPIPAGAERKVVLEYKQLLRKSQSLTELLYPLSTAKFTSKPLEKLNLRIAVDSNVDIRNVYSPSHPVNVERPDNRRAVITYTRTGDVPTTDFRLFYDVQPGQLGTSVLTYRPNEKEDGYFLLLTTPQLPVGDAPPAAKTIVFVVDRSGSMAGKKIEQARQALKSVLNNLREGDTLNIVSYEGAVESFRPELEKFTDATRKAALAYADGLYAGGGTNIHDALTTALKPLTDTSRPSYLLFLTDGLPTVGETNESKIAAAVKAANRAHVRLLNFGVGYDVNSRLLDRLARENSGASEYVRPEDDIEVAVSRVFSRISSPVLTNVDVQFQFDGPWSGPNPITRMYPGSGFDLFAGEQVVIVGRYRRFGAAKVILSGAIGPDHKVFDFPADFIEKSGDQTLAFVEKLWATRRIGELIDQLDLNGHNQELVNELVALSTKHGILTPYTSFLADESVRPDVASLSNQARTTRELELLVRSPEGKAGVAQRFGKNALREANGAPAASKPAPADGLPGAATYFSVDDKQVVASTVRNLGNQALYKRGRVVVTPDTANLDVEKDAASITTVDRYSSEYFAIVSANSPEENQILANQASDEDLLVRLRGKAYLIK
ncbi:von Willebrand factor type A domain protein [Caulifigura coniformis]|uniref:von Willebrand factor type A domain protein n=1 Tax=Caulifigura coniformis TaxID=2527983 RepID=A0A517SMJ7_9PLAN|nr:VIT and VWA domain-containing protein [Caulifigura coniformis]QDT57350.1 von Willebrand factor type A domain protein [Caulifigura coniformis]